MRCHDRIHTRIGQEDGPGDDPDREEHDGDHTEETDKEVGVHAVDTLDIRVICFEHSWDPCKEAMTDRVDSFT